MMIEFWLSMFLLYLSGVAANLVMLVIIYDVDYTDFKKNNAELLGIVTPLMSWISFVILLFMLLFLTRK